MTTKDSRKIMREEGYRAYLRQCTEHDPTLYTYSLKDISILQWSFVFLCQDRFDLLWQLESDYSNTTRRFQQYIRIFRLDSFFYAQNKRGTYTLTRLHMLILLYMLALDRGINDRCILKQAIKNITDENIRMAQHYLWALRNDDRHPNDSMYLMVTPADKAMFYEIMFDFLKSEAFQPGGIYFKREQEILKEDRIAKHQRIEVVSEEQMHDFMQQISLRCDEVIQFESLMNETQNLLSQKFNLLWSDKDRRSLFVPMRHDNFEGLSLEVKELVMHHISDLIETGFTGLLKAFTCE